MVHKSVSYLKTVKTVIIDEGEEEENVNKKGIESASIASRIKMTIEEQLRSIIIQ